MVRLLLDRRWLFLGIEQNGRVFAILVASRSVGRLRLGVGQRHTVEQRTRFFGKVLVQSTAQVAVRVASVDETSAFLGHGGRPLDGTRHVAVGLGVGLGVLGLALGGCRATFDRTLGDGALGFGLGFRVGRLARIENGRQMLGLARAGRAR